MSEVVTLPPCRHCRCRKFTLTFAQGKLRYRIVAKCCGCGRGRVVGLDAAYNAARPINQSEPSTTSIREFLQSGSHETYQK